MPFTCISLPQDLTDRFSMFSRDLGMSLAEATAFLIENAPAPIRVTQDVDAEENPTLFFFGENCGQVSSQDLRYFAADLRRVASRPGSVCNPGIGISATHHGESVLLWRNTPSANSPGRSVSSDWAFRMAEELRREADVWDSIFESACAADAEFAAAFGGVQSHTATECAQTNLPTE